MERTRRDIILGIGDINAIVCCQQTERNLIVLQVGRNSILWGNMERLRIDNRERFCLGIQHIKRIAQQRDIVALNSKTLGYHIALHNRKRRGDIAVIAPTGNP